MNDKKYHYFYEGKIIKLRGIEKEDYTEKMYKWANDNDFNRFLSHGIRPTTIQKMEKLYEALINKENFIFAIVDKRTEKTIGLIGLYNPNWQIRSIEYVIHIGEKYLWDSNESSEATNFIIKYAFETLNLNKVWLGIAKENQRAIKFYQKKGFVHEGELRAEIFRENKYFNSVRMSILKEEYMKIDIVNPMTNNSQYNTNNQCN